MKRIVAVVLAAVQLAASGSVLAQNQKVTVRLNGTELSLPAEPFIENDRTLVPLRGVFESVGANVLWDQDTQSIFISKNMDDGMKAIVMQIGNADVFVGEEKRTLDTAPQIVGDSTFVPLRFVIDELGETVEWDQNTYTVDITTK